MKFSLPIFIFTRVAAALLLAGCDSKENAAAMNASSANVKHLTAAEFATEVASATNAVVADFYATWCGPCRRLSPMLDGLAGGYADKIKFVKINVDESAELAKKFEVSGIPTLIFFRDGKVADRIVGLPESAELKAKLAAFAGRGGGGFLCDVVRAVPRVVADA